MSDIFMSYASADRPRVKPLVDALQRQGWSVWWDRTILAGKTFDRVIQAALTDSRCVIVLWSKDSVESDWVWIEADERKWRGILVPVMLDDVVIPFAFRRIQTANLIGWSGALQNDQFSDLNRAVSEVLSNIGSSPPDGNQEQDGKLPAQGGRREEHVHVAEIARDTQGKGVRLKPEQQAESEPGKIEQQEQEQEQERQAKLKREAMEDLGNQLYKKLLSEGKSGGAKITALRKIIEFNPNKIEARHDLASELEKLGRLDEALEEYRSLIELNVDDDVAKRGRHSAIWALLEERNEDQDKPQEVAVPSDPTTKIIPTNEPPPTPTPAKPSAIWSQSEINTAVFLAAAIPVIVLLLFLIFSR